MSKPKRRAVLAAGALAALPFRVFAQTAAAARPRLLQGVQSGDVGGNGATLWSRADRPARMIAEYATTESFADLRRIAGPLALETSGFTSRLRLEGLPPGQTIFYRIAYADPSDAKATSDWVQGSFRTPPATAGDLSFVLVGRHGRPGLGDQIPRPAA